MGSITCPPFALVGDDLLRAQRDLDGVLRQGQRFVARALVCKLCVPPSTAASACSVTRTMLLSACCAVRVLPPVCVRKRSRWAFRPSPGC